jgi:DNA polymerase phi
VPAVFTPNFLRTLSNNLSKADTYLHATAKRCLERISTFMEKADPEARMAVSVALQRHGGAAFARLAKTKSAGQAVEVADASGLLAYVRQLQAKFSEAGGDGDEEDVIRQQQWAVEQLAGVVKQGGAPAEVKLVVLRFLGVRAFFATEPAQGSKVRWMMVPLLCS